MMPWRASLVVGECVGVFPVSGLLNHTGRDWFFFFSFLERVGANLPFPRNVKNSILFKKKETLKKKKEHLGPHKPFFSIWYVTDGVCNNSFCFWFDILFIYPSFLYERRSCIFIAFVFLWVGDGRVGGYAS